MWPSSTRGKRFCYDDQLLYNKRMYLSTDLHDSICESARVRYDDSREIPRLLYGIHFNVELKAWIEDEPERSY